VKSLDTLARSLVILKERGVSFRAVIIGGGDEGKHDVQKIIDDGDISRCVDITGALDRDGVKDFLARSDIFVLPSISEGIPVTIMEAMAMELPVVATDISGIPEIVMDGKTGFLIPKEDPQALADRLEHLMADEELRRSMGREGRRLIVERYNVYTNVERLEGLFMDRGPFQRVHYSS
jgi:glycosyltransferase involved in cell wall biosynthesis